MLLCIMKGIILLEGRSEKMEINAETIYEQTKGSLNELLQLDRDGLNHARLLVIGASSSEIAGGVLGHNSTYEYGEAVVRAALEVGKMQNVDLAFQCCEHLNRALVMEREAAEYRGYERVCVVPQVKAGGSLATAAWKLLHDPVVVLSAQADAGLDIGLTLIGMHLKRVAIPIRLEHRTIGNAIVAAARTRPMLIGGERAVYTGGR